jgi:hypothetical protein
MLEEVVVHLPELPLILGSESCFGGEVRVVPVFVRIVFDDEAQSALVFFHEAFNDRTGRCAMGSLIIEELEDRDRRIGGTECGRVVDGHRISLLLPEGE